MGRLGEAHAIVARLRRITSGVGRGDSWFRNAEHRELYLSGLRLASGADSGITAAPPRDTRRDAAPIEHVASAASPQAGVPRDAAPIDHSDAERRQITVLSCELVDRAAGARGMDLEESTSRSGSFGAACRRRPIAMTGSSPDISGITRSPVRLPRGAGARRRAGGPRGARIVRGGQGPENRCGCADAMPRRHRDGIGHHRRFRRSRRVPEPRNCRRHPRVCSAVAGVGRTGHGGDRSGDPAPNRQPVIGARRVRDPQPARRWRRRPHNFKRGWISWH
jgi:hypothetical protein